jgi:pyrimidine-nucleoside phosphorylase
LIQTYLDTHPIGEILGAPFDALLSEFDIVVPDVLYLSKERARFLTEKNLQGPPDLVEISLAFAARMLVLAGVAAAEAEALQRVRQSIASGQALDCFRRIIETQGGDPRVVDDYGRLPAAPERSTIAASRGGYVTQIDAELVGRASVVLGAGPDRVEDDVDPAVGIILKTHPGAAIRAGDPVLELHYRTIDRRDAARALAERAIVIDDAPPPERPQIVARIS